jgi:uroporphyrinogen decarboxylase
MTSSGRVAAAMAWREPDRVPFVLSLTLHGARAMGMGIRDYFHRPDLVAEAQVRMRARYRHDALIGATYAAVELEAFGGETLFFEDGPPNGGAPVLRRAGDILRLEPPRIGEAPALLRILDLLGRLRERARGEVPVMGVVLSPLSLPVLQLGFERYLQLLEEAPDLFARLMAVNAAFCTAWANAQLEAGADFLAYVDPVGSPTVLPPDRYRALGLPLATATLAAIHGPTLTHFASGRCLAVIEDLVRTGTRGVAANVQEDLAEVKRAARGRLAVVGNLDGIRMRRWSAREAEDQVKAAIARAGRGGGWILSDQHGEIPWQVPEAVLDAVSAAVHRWGVYPLDWVEPEAAP